MKSSGTLQTLQSNVLDYLEQRFFLSEFDVDVKSHFFYVYKLFPTGMTKDELRRWCELQCDVLSPFRQQHHYKYLSEHGIHIWYSKHVALGIPETAVQTAEQDGEHLAVGHHYHYKQNWQGGVMTSCIAMPKNSAEEYNDNIVDIQSPWAVNRHIESILTSPKTWGRFNVALWLIVTIGITSAWATQTYQQHYLSEYNGRLSEEIGPKLNKRTELTEASAIIDSLHSWQVEYYNLPNALGSALAELNNLSSIIINRWQWQNKQIAVEFVAENIDITALVEQTQSLDGVQIANIKPHNNANTWVLEIQWN